MGNDFWDTGRFSKLPYSGMKLDHWPKCQRLHIYSLSTPRGRNWAYFSSTGSGFEIQADFQNFSLKLAIGHRPKLQKLHIYPVSTPGGQNLAYFRSTGPGFQDTCQFSNLPYLSMKLDKWPKLQKVHIYPLSTPRGQKWAYFSSTGSGFRDWASKLVVSQIQFHWLSDF